MIFFISKMIHNSSHKVDKCRYHLQWSAKRYYLQHNVVQILYFEKCAKILLNCNCKNWFYIVPTQFLRFTIFLSNFRKNTTKTVLNLKIPPNCYDFFHFL